MGLLNWFKSKNGSGAEGDPAQPLTVDIGKNGLSINGSLLPELTLAALDAVLGAHRVASQIRSQGEAADPLRIVAIWDETGVRAFSADSVRTSELELRLAEDKLWESSVKYDYFGHNPQRVFSGLFTVDGKPPLQAAPEKALKEVYSWVEWKTGNWDITLGLRKELSQVIADMPFSERLKKSGTDEIANWVRAAPQPFREVSISYQAAKPKPAKDSQKWKLPKPQGAVLSFSHLPFKIAVVQELMYQQERLKPQFDVHDFARNHAARDIDPDSYYFEMIPEVKAWFEGLPVPASLAEHVERLYFDGGNDIYLELIPQWDGEDDQFKVTELSEQELAQFPNLREVVGSHWLSPEVTELLTRHGVVVVD